MRRIALSTLIAAVALCAIIVLVRSAPPRRPTQIPPPPTQTQTLEDLIGRQVQTEAQRSPTPHRSPAHLRDKKHWYSAFTVSVSRDSGGAGEER